MDADKIIQKGDTAMYQLAINDDDFEQKHGDFFVILRHGMKGDTLTIKKEQMLYDGNGRWFLTFRTSGLSFGRLEAETHYFVNDSDIECDLREVVRLNFIGFVTDSPCPMFASDCRCKDDDVVQLTRILDTSAYMVCESETIDKGKIVQKGAVAKFHIEIDHKGFSQRRHDFFVILHYGMTGRTLRIDKEQMICEANTKWIFSFPTANLPSGYVKAETHYLVPDNRFRGGFREEVEWSCLCFITDSLCTSLSCHCHCNECASAHVAFTRIWKSSPYVWLRTVRKEPLDEKRGRKLRVLKQNIKENEKEA